MNNNPMGYNQGMDSNAFGINTGASQVEGNPTLNLLNQSTGQFGGPTGNPTLDLLNQGNGGMAPQNNNQFYNSGNPTLDLLNESQAQAPQDGGYNFVATPSETPADQASPGGAFSFLSQNEAQSMNSQFGGMPTDNSSFNTQPIPPIMEQPQMEPVPSQPQPNAYGFVPMMNQSVPEQPTQPMQQPVQPQVNPSMGTVEELNFSFIPLREEAPVQQPQPVQMPVSNQPTADQVFGQAQVMQPQAMPQNMSQPMNNMMPQQGMLVQPMQPQMGTFQPAMQTGVVQQSLDTLFPTGMPDGNGNFPQ